MKLPPTNKENNVVPLFGEVLHDESCDVYLKKVLEDLDLSRVIIIGETEEGSLFLGANTGNMEALSWLMLRANTQMMKITSKFETEDDGLLS